MPSRTSTVSSTARAHPSARTFGLLSTFPPTACGIATFSAALATGLKSTGAAVDVVRLGADGAPDGPLDVLDACDVAIVQHEYGIYGGRDGDDVVAMLEALAVPSIVVAHTVLQAPTPHQREVLEQVCASAAVVVVMTESARQRLIDGFDIGDTSIEVIPHGAASAVAADTSRAGRRADPRILTWGLLGPGKGIEWAIDAMAAMADMRPRPRYVVAGATHPKVLERDGDAYRRMLIERSWNRGVAPWVEFEDTYRDLDSLNGLISTADVVVLPYDSVDQVTSGVLVDAVAAGRPVVATAFPHAVELLATGAGSVVPQRDPVALAAAVRAIVTDRELAASMAAEARRLAPGLSWTAIAGRYATLAEQFVAAEAVSA